MTTTTTKPCDWDVRVRDRNLKNGTLTDKAVEKVKAALPDLDAECESFTLDQPAIGGREDVA